MLPARKHGDRVRALVRAALPAACLLLGQGNGTLQGFAASNRLRGDTP
jgi:hypothetical protein